MRTLTSVPGRPKLLKILIPGPFVEFFSFIYLFTSDTFVLAYKELKTEFLIPLNWKLSPWPLFEAH